MSAGKLIGVGVGPGDPELMTLKAMRALGEADLEEIYATYIAPSRATDRIDTVNSRMLGEIKQVLDTIDAATGTATNYSASLADATAKLDRASDGEALRAVVERIVKGAKDMELNNKKLEARLSASKQEIEQLQENLQAVRTESLTDPLTTLSNRKFFDQALAKAMTEAKESNQPLALLMADIDHFKTFNDKFGHLTGDQVLRLVALSVKQNVKGQDVAARYGGEEFAVVLPRTGLQQALVVGDHIRRAVMGKELMKRSTGEHLGRITISVGVATFRPNDTAQSFIGRADAGLYAAKRNGRNRIEALANAGSDKAPC